MIIVVDKFRYRGKNTEELKALSIEEFAKLAKSRPRRAITRGFTPAQKKLLKDIRKNKDNSKNSIKTHCRDMVIIPEMIGVNIGIHNGKEFVFMEIKGEMLGKRLGDFSMTRNKVKHSAPGFGATRSSKFVPLK